MATAQEEILAAKRRGQAALDPKRQVQPLRGARAQIRQDSAAQTKQGRSDAYHRKAGDAAVDAVGQIIGAGAQSRLDALSRGVAAQQKFADAIHGAEGRFYDGMLSQEIPLRTWYAEADRALDAEYGGRRGGGYGGGGGGGGGSGGGSGDPDDAYWWNWYYDQGLNQTFGGASSGGLSRLNNYIKDEAAYGPRSSAPGWARRQAIAAELGVPEEYARAQFKTTPFGRLALQTIAAGRDASEKRKRRLVGGLRKSARKTEGQQRPTVQFARSQLGLAPKAPRINWW